MPDPPVGPFDSTRVNASDHAYSRLQTPGAALMLVDHGVAAALASAGGTDRAERNPALPLAPAAKTGWDTVSALRLGVEEWRENRALCAYCQAATLASLASFVLALPEAGRALRALSR